MWDRVALKEEAKKVFTYKDNYWKFILVALIAVILSGGISGAVSGVPGVISGAVRSITGSNSHNKHIQKDYVTEDVTYDRVSTHVQSKDIDIDSDELEKAIREGRIEEYLNQHIKEYNYDTPSNSTAEPPVRPEPDIDSVGQAAGIGIIVGIIILISLIISLCAMAITFTIKAFLINPILLGTKVFFLRSYDRPSDLKDLGHGFKTAYIKNVRTLFLRDIFIFLWTLLFIVPGIIKAYEYRMIPYLIAENPDMSYQEAFKKSKDMMMGNKWNAFVLDLSFLGWFVLSSLTCGILGVFYVNPYYYVTDANLYRALKNQNNDI